MTLRDYDANDDETPLLICLIFIKKEGREGQNAQLLAKSPVPTLRHLRHCVIAEPGTRWPTGVVEAGNGAPLASLAPLDEPGTRWPTGVVEARILRPLRHLRVMSPTSSGVAEAGHSLEVTQVTQVPAPG